VNILCVVPVYDAIYKRDGLSKQILTNMGF
jgi:hypothetical protein